MSDHDHDGWIGTRRQFEHAMRTYGAEEEDGCLLCAGELPASFMGAGDELIVSSKVRVRIKGSWVSAVGLLYSTSYGVKVKVF